MELLLHMILYLTIYQGVTGLDEYAENNATTVTPSSNQHDYIVSLNSTISEDAVPKYLIDAMYSDPNFKNASKDILDFFKFNTSTLNDTLDILQALNLSSDVIFSINALNYTLNVTQTSFNTFYENLRINLISQASIMKQALTALQIDTVAFSEALAYGDAFEEFAKGNFSKDNIKNTVEILNITTDRLFEEIRSFFYDKLMLKEDLVGLLRDLLINETQALTIWQKRQVYWTALDVYNTPTFKAVLDKATTEIYSRQILGVLVKFQEVFFFFFKVSYDFLKPYLELIILNAVSLDGKQTYTVNTTNNSVVFPNIILLKQNVSSNSSSNDNGTVSSILTGYSKTSLLNCSYVTITNSSIDSVDIPIAIYNDSVYLIPVNSSTNVIEGSALICNGSLYGLAREAADGNIIIDSFLVDDVPSTSTPKTSTNVTNVTESSPPSTTQSQDKDNKSGVSMLMSTFMLISFSCSILLGTYI